MVKTRLGLAVSWSPLSKAHLLICRRLSSYIFKYLGAGTTTCHVSGGNPASALPAGRSPLILSLGSPELGTARVPLERALGHRQIAPSASCLQCKRLCTPSLPQENVPAQTDQHASGQQGSQRKAESSASALPRAGGCPVMGTGQEGRRAEDGFACRCYSSLRLSIYFC